MRKLAFIIVFSFALTFGTYAQNIGITAGGGTSFVFWKSDDAEINKTINDGFTPVYAYNGGFSFENGLIEKQLYLQLGLFAMKKGYSYKDEDSDFEEGMDLHYFHIPLELKYKFFFDSDEQFSFNIGAGGYFGGGFGGKKWYTGSEDDPDFDPAVKYGKTEDQDMRDMDWGLQFRGELGLANFRLGYDYVLGLANANLMFPEDFQMSHRAHQIYLAYFFTNN